MTVNTPHASLSISDTEVLKEMKEKYYDCTLMKINLFSFAPGSIMTTTSRLRWFQVVLCLVLFPDFMFLQGANAATIWMHIGRITLVAKIQNKKKKKTKLRSNATTANSPHRNVAFGVWRWAPPPLSSLCCLQQSAWKAFLDDKSAQRSIYCHREFTDCLQHGRHIPPTAVFTVL